MLSYAGRYVTDLDDCNDWLWVEEAFDVCTELGWCAYVVPLGAGKALSYDTSVCYVLLPPPRPPLPCLL